MEQPPSSFRSWLAKLSRAFHELTFGEEKFESLLTLELEAAVLTAFDAARAQNPQQDPMELLQAILLTKYPHVAGHERTLEKLKFHFARKRGLLQS